MRLISKDIIIGFPNLSMHIIRDSLLKQGHDTYNNKMKSCFVVLKKLFFSIIKIKK